MAHFAEIDDDYRVVRVLVIPDDQEHRGQEYLANDLGLGGTWIQTSYNTNGGIHQTGGTPIRKNYAGIGMKYDSARDAFIANSPGADFIFDEESCTWKKPQSDIASE